MREHRLPPRRPPKGAGRNSRGTAAGASAFRLGALPGVPGEVQASFLLWLTAVAAGVAETVIRVIGSLAGGPDSGGLLVRAVVYAAAVYVISRMRLGKRWARLTLAVVLGGIGTLSLVIDPISWLAAGNPLGEVLARADLLFAFVAPIRAVHLAAVVAALVFMFLPAANAYFRRASAKRARTGR
jgi:hypothetical protein